jgi:hypothetical protein
MLLIHRTYELILPHDEDEDVCEPDESGFDSVNEKVSFRDLVGMLRGGECSDSAINDDFRSRASWVTHYGEQDYRDGSYRNESIHFSGSNEIRKLRYWNKALRLAGYK